MFSEFRKNKFRYFFNLLDLNKNELLEFNDFSDMAELVRTRLGLDAGSKAHRRIADKATRFFHHLLEDIKPKLAQSIEINEWVSFFENHLGESFEEEDLATYQDLIFQYFFDFFDENHDGFITINEYEIFFDIFNIDKSDFDVCFKQIDTNGDGKISRYEMLGSIEDFLISDDPKASGNWTFGNWESDPA